MHDFCLTIPYGIAVLLGGLIGFFRRGSTASLMGGGTTGLLLLLASRLSLRAYQKGLNSYVALLLETVLSVVLTLVMGQRYQSTGKIMPAGLVAAVSGIMAIFYLYKVVTGGNHIPKKVV